MNSKAIWKRTGFILLALFLALQPLWAGAEQAKASIVSMRPTGRGAANGADMQVTAQTTEDRVVAQVFVNMINQALERNREEGQEEWEDPSLAQYPLDPHELWEYGPSPRIRFLADEEDIRRVTAALEAGELKEEDAENINYLVYRESILLIGQEEAGQYTVVYGKDKRSATLTPALPLEALEGKTGIVLLGENVIQDQVLMLEGTPALRDGAGPFPGGADGAAPESALQRRPVFPEARGGAPLGPGPGGQRQHDRLRRAAAGRPDPGAAGKIGIWHQLVGQGIRLCPRLGQLRHRPGCGRLEAALQYGRYPGR